MSAHVVWTLLGINPGSLLCEPVAWIPAELSRRTTKYFNETGGMRPIKRGYGMNGCEEESVLFTVQLFTKESYN
jgi:hypothetical protein